MPKGKSNCVKCGQTFNSSVFGKHRMYCRGVETQALVPSVNGVHKVADDYVLKRAFDLAVQFQRLPLSAGVKDALQKTAAECTGVK